MNALLVTEVVLDGDGETQRQLDHGLLLNDAASKVTSLLLRVSGWF